MKILHVITSLRTGGAEKLMVELLPLLRNDGYEVELAIFNGEDTPFFRQLSKTGISIHSFMPNKGNVYSLSNLIKLSKLIRKGEYDIVHTHNTAPQLFAALCKNKNFKLVTTEHGGSNRRRNWGWYRRIDRLMYERYDKIICIAKKAEENLREYIGKANVDIATINNGVDVAKFAEAIPSPELERIAPGSRKIMMVAGFRWEKDQDTLIKALQYLPDEFHLFLVGNGIRKNELEKLCLDQGLSERVHFLGIRSDIPQLLHAADFIVMSSHFEGLSLSSVEGMSVGKPFLASDVDGLREVVKDAGILFPHGHSDTFANEILRLESDQKEYHRVASQCYSRAKNFDISKMKDGYLEIYNSL
ncbi:MAG: glycosyltransferase [Muribaculaceae bacterium]|nr:glycosyltransferase [Muribaculaceae bacterium]